MERHSNFLDAEDEKAGLKKMSANMEIIRTCSDALIDANRNWAYIYINSYEVKKKSIISNGFKILEEYNRAPKSTAEIYKCIRKKHEKVILAF